MGEEDDAAIAYWYGGPILEDDDAPYANKHAARYESEVFLVSSDSRALHFYRQNVYSLGEHLQGAAEYEYGGPIFEEYEDDYV